MIALLKQYKTIVAGVALAVAFVAGWLANSWRLGVQIAEIRQDLETHLHTPSLAVSF